MYEIPALLNTLSGLSTFFHTSARRTADLDQIAADNNLTVRRFPKLYEVRWSEFTTALLDSVLVSWKVQMKYFTLRSQTASEGDKSRFRKALTKVDNIRLMYFLADLLFLLQNFQKKLQSDSITIIDLKPQLSVFIQKVIAMEKAPLLGGWEEVLARGMQTVEGTHSMFDVELWTKQRRRQASNLYVTDTRDFAAIRHDSLQAIQNFMSSRLSYDDTFESMP